MSRSTVPGAAALAIVALTSTAARAETARCEIAYGAIVADLRPNQTTVHQQSVPSSTHFGSHGQLIFGEDKVYLHHLPFLQADPSRHPHNFQVLMRVSFVDEADRQAYLQRRKLRPDALFTALPDDYGQIWLKTIFEAGAKGQELGEVEIFDEHFENDPRPRPFLKAEMVIDEVLEFRELDPDGPTADELRYMIVETEQEAFLIHEVSSPPDFDQVLKVTLTPAITGASEVSLDRGMLRLIGADNAEGGRLIVGDALTCSAHDGTRRLPFDVAVAIERETYCEAGELSAVAESPSFEGKRACAPE